MIFAPIRRAARAHQTKRGSVFPDELRDAATARSGRLASISPQRGSIPYSRATFVSEVRGACPAGLRQVKMKRRSSGEKQHKGRITKAGNGRLRYLLVQVALSILRLRSPRTEVLREWAERIAARRGRMITVVALARRMAGILYAMMRDGKPYQPARPKLSLQAAAA